MTAETEAEQHARLEAEVVGEIAEQMLSGLTETTNESIEELVEEHLALVGLCPMVPYSSEDEQVQAEYLAWANAQRRIYRLAWIALAKKLIDLFVETEGE